MHSWTTKSRKKEFYIYTSETPEESLHEPTKTPKPNKNEDHDLEGGDLLNSDIPERRDSHASSSHEPSSVFAPARIVDLGKHNVHTHFPEDRDCENCQRTKMIRAPCRRRNGEAVPRAANFGDLITADHKVPSDNCESRNDHRYAIVVQDLATQWIQSCPCKTKTSQQTQRACKSSWNPRGSLKSFTLTIPWHLAKLVKIFPGIIVRRHHTDRKQMGLLKEQCTE